MVFFFTKDGGSLIGGSGLHDVNWDLGHFEVGYWGRSGYGGRGLMTEGVRALSSHALMQLGASRVFLTTDKRNMASWRLKSPNRPAEWWSVLGCLQEPYWA